MTTDTQSQAKRITVVDSLHSRSTLLHCSVHLLLYLDEAFPSWSAGGVMGKSYMD